MAKRKGSAVHSLQSGSSCGECRPRAMRWPTWFWPTTITIAVYVGIHFGLRPRVNQHFIISDDNEASTQDLSAELAERALARNRTPDYTWTLIFTSVPHGPREDSVRALLKRMSALNNFTLKTSPTTETDAILNEEKGKVYAEEISKIAERLKTPLVHDTYKPFIDFERVALIPRPAYASFVSDPINRFVNEFKEVRTVKYWQVRVAKIPEKDRLRHMEKILDVKWEKKVFNDCVMTDDPECVPLRGTNRTSMVSHFCGIAPECRVHHSRVALEQAKRNMESFFSVVGVVGMEIDTLRALQAYLPLFMQGAVHHKSNLGLDVEAVLPPRVRKKLMKVLAMDIELFRFTQQRLAMQINKLNSQL
ncbi:heparan sulfate 2-O-sulfotransferase pipe-like [Cloeon dipterum]|uniref:heparan sulfate 2-O-sulfotransferase pipe-like n=1 Tax=Cloeon dipterum TaxID=197152 RepID=UPI003220392D